MFVHLVVFDLYLSLSKKSHEVSLKTMSFHLLIHGRLAIVFGAQCQDLIEGLQAGNMHHEIQLHISYFTYISGI